MRVLNKNSAFKVDLVELLGRFLAECVEFLVKTVHAILKPNHALVKAVHAIFEPIHALVEAVNALVKAVDTSIDLRKLLEEFLDVNLCGWGVGPNRENVTAPDLPN